MSNKIEIAIISNAINTLCLTCAAPREMVIEQLTGWLWDEEEAGEILRSLDRFDITMLEKENLSKP